ncbi:MAG: hypothetical protein AAF938_27130 [Myxococcota bacterium]
MIRSAVIIIGLSIALPAHAWADEGDRERAIELAVEARERFAAGESAEAAEMLQRALNVYPEPILLYNLGRVYDTMGIEHEDEALAAYEAYLERAPDAADRAAIEQRITSLRASQDERRALREARDAERRRREAAEREAAAQAAQRGPSALPWIVLATGGAALATGGVFGGLALRSNRDAKVQTEHIRAAELADEASSRATVANALLVVGGVVAATGLVWLIVDRRRSRARRQVRVGVGPAALSVQGSW